MSELTLDQATDIAEKIQLRQERFEGEPLFDSIMVVLLNYGSGYARVICINGEWEGIKNELPPATGIPLCPNGHPMLEITQGKKLGLID